MQDLTTHRNVLNELASSKPLHYLASASDILYDRADLSIRMPSFLESSCVPAYPLGTVHTRPGAATACAPQLLRFRVLDFQDAQDFRLTSVPNPW